MSADRNLPCPCGSGLKYKKCCLPKQQAVAPVEAGWLRMRRTEGELVERLTTLLKRDYGRESVTLAWDEYTLWPEPEADPQEWPEFETSFVPWLLFDWEPGRYAPKRRKKRAGADGDNGGRPAMSPARHLIARRGANLDSYELRYLEEACSRPYTYCQVVSAEPGRLLTLRDILRHQDVTVHERQASTMLLPGQIIYTKIVSLDGASVMLGCAPIVLPGGFFETIAQARDLILKRRGTAEQLLHKYDVELRQLYLDLRKAATEPAAPALQNTDGDPLQMTRLDFELGCAPQQALDALLPLTGGTDPAGFADAYEHDADGTLVAAEIPWLRLQGGHRSAQNTVLATFEIRADRMTVHVNSQRRAEAVLAEIAARLGDRARLKGTVVESPEQILAAARASGAGPASPAAAAREREQEELQQLPEVQAMLARLNDEHWATWPDIPLPALRGRTPREAARSTAGRERLEALLLEFAGRQRTPNAPGPDLAALRRELGLDRELPAPQRTTTEPAAAARGPAVAVADLRPYVDVPGQALRTYVPRSAVQLRNIVEVATVFAAATPQPTVIPCRRRPQRQACPGNLHAHQEVAAGEIHWFCPVCGDAGRIHHWQGTPYDHGGRPSLPKVSRICLATGFQRRPGDAAALKELVFAGDAVTDALRRAILDNLITELGGEYGDPSVGSPIQVDRLEIEDEVGTTRITVYNRAIMLVHTDDEVMRRLHRVCGAVERAGDG